MLRAVTPSSNPVLPTSLSTYKGPVFHYTSSGGLLGILESRSIRASAASSLNDLAEVRQGWTLIREILAAQPGSGIVDMLQKFASKPLQDAHEVFVLSGSTEGDDANQWRLYADNGRGYALELDGSVQLAAISDDPGGAALPGPLGVPARDVASVTPWHRVLYSRGEVKLAVEELIDAVNVEEQSITRVVGLTEDAAQWYYEDLQDHSYEALSAIAALIKSPGFVGENEVRVVVTFTAGDAHISHRASPDGIVGFARLAEAPDGHAQLVIRPTSKGVPLVTRLPLTSVRLGPLLRPEHVSTVSAFLRINKFGKVSVNESAVPLR